MFSVALLLLLAAGCVKCEQLTQPASVTVQPGQRLTITCQVSYSLSYYTAWIRQPAGKGLEWIGMRSTGYAYYKDSLKNKFSIDLDTSSKTVTLNGQNVQPEDTAVYYCARELYGSGGFDYWGKGTQVTVTSATSTKPTVFPLVQCGSGPGDTITLGCYATGFTPSSPLSYAWSKEGTALTPSIQYPPVQTGSHYTGISQIQVSKQDWDARKIFQCAVTHPAGNGQAVYRKIEVTYQLPILSVLGSCSDEKSEASFSCFAKDFSPKDHKITWLKDDTDITDKIYEITTPVQERKDVNGTWYSTASFLGVPNKDLTKGTRFTCLFEGKGENVKTYVNESVTYGYQCPDPTTCAGADADITIIGPTNEDMFMSGKGKIICQVQENKPSVLSVLWEDEFGNKLVDNSKSTINGKKIINLELDITYDEWHKGIKRYCAVEHSEWLEPVKKLYERSIGGTIQRPSVFMMPPVEHTRKEMVTLTCFVKDFFPQEVYVSWLVDDEEVDSTYEFHTTDPVESYGSYSAYGQLLLSLEQWKRNDVVYSCVVHHESVVNTTKAIVRSIGYRTFEKNTNLVNLNMNVPETCKPQ